MKVFKKGRLEKILDKLSESAEVYVPMMRGAQSGFFDYKTYNPDFDELVLEALNVLRPPKEVVFPQTEKMYSFKQEGQDVIIDKVYEDENPRIIFGIRACDLKAIEYLDEVFLTCGYEDAFYKKRRENTVFIANACYTPGKNCFCESMGVNPVEPELADIVLREYSDEGYVWEVKTEKGENITRLISDLLEDKEVQLPELKKFVIKVDYDGVAEKLKGLFEHPMWDRLSEPCQTCGICTYICPTCHCFDIQVKAWGDEGYRFRCWDSCMYREYTQMAGGHNPRETAKERFRNRFLHKLEFFYERYGKPLCTGCGRCVFVCPSGVSIVKIIEEIKGA
ncbi:4Fe-4S dicluster domain-containing protein [Thermosyntropha sp.]|uniref:4Fe-4S dicluster domain-containing protein n=1 Tax=Thermosyntropha sp. TaxID=2740820 RepID=UPI0025D5156C|nr:4Fe-4S dicluster domain-containing protein [Thermosyntropha sp.]MBO8159855.1 4Fe-4S dicluster domain-containing protein [Thermosyntropha sp.]